MPATWLSLLDYANKYKVSISTLRRKIKVEDIPFRLDTGKYFIIDEPLEVIGKTQGDQLELEKMESAAEKNLENPSNKNPEKHPKNISPNNSQAPESYRQVSSEGGESVLVAANRLLDEIKKAYTLILQEKDEQVRQLREEISDLKTLVRVLEGENERLTKDSKETLYFD